MPRKKPDNSKFTVEMPPAIEADTLLLTRIIPATAFYTTTELTIDPITGDPKQASGNIAVGDELAVDDNGDFIYSEKFSVSYIALDGTTVVKTGTAILTEAELATLIGNNPTGRDMIKTVGYDALEIIGIAPADSVVT